jgi:hypothetical protein
MKAALWQKVVHIVFESIIDKSKPSKLCIRINRNEQFANIDETGNFRHFSRDDARLNCTLKPLAAVVRNYLKP